MNARANFQAGLGRGRSSEGFLPVARSLPRYYYPRKTIGRYTSIRQCRTMAEGEGSCNRAVSLTAGNGTAVSIGRFLCVAGGTLPLRSLAFHKTKRQRIQRKRKQEGGREGGGERSRGEGERYVRGFAGETPKGEGKPWRIDVTKTSRTVDERTNERVHTYQTGERMRARPMDATSPAAHRPALCTRH